MADSKFETELLIKAGVKGLADIAKLIQAIDETGGDTKELRSAFKDLGAEWDKLSTDKQVSELEALAAEAQKLQEIAKAKITLGIDADDRARRELLAAKRAYETLKNSGKLTSAELARANELHTAKVARLEAQLQQTNVAASQSAGGIGKLGKSVAGLAGAYIGVDAITSGIRELVDTSKGLDSLNQKLAYATGSAKEAGETWDYLKDLANELGLEQVGLANGYAQLASATKNLNLSQADTKQAFEGVANASAAMSLTTDEANGVFLALSQIAGKGKVSMEELRGQLGERLTPAMGIAAKAMGVTTIELEKMVENGIDAQEFLPKFGGALTEAFGAQAQNNITTTTGALNNLSNKTTDLKEKLLDGFAGESISSGIKQLGQSIDGISQAIDDIDPATIDATKEVFIQSAEAAKTLAGFIIDTYDQVSSLVNAFAGLDGADEQVGLITRSMQGLGIIIGGVNDVFKGLRAAAQFTIGGIASALADMYENMSQIGLLPDDLQAKYKQLSDSLRQVGDDAFAGFEKGVNEFESSTVAALDRATGKGKAQLQALANEAKAAYDGMVATGSYSTDELKAQWLDYAQKTIAANNGIATEQLRVESAQRGVAIAALESADAFKVGAGLSADALAGLAEVGKATGASLEAGLTRALNAASNKAEIDQVIGQLGELQAQGRITGVELAEGINKANARYAELGDSAKKSAEKASDAKDAFLVYAQEQISANDDVISKQLKSEAALHGYQVVLDETGKVAVTAWQEVQDGASGAADAITAANTTSFGGILKKDLDEASGSFKALSLDATEFATGISDKVNQALNSYVAVSKLAGDNTEQLARAYNAAKEKAKDNVQAQNLLDEKLKEVTKDHDGLAEKVRLAAKTQQEAKTASEAQADALDKLGIKMDAVNAKMSKSGSEMVQTLKNGVVAIKEQATSSEALKVALSDALDVAIPAAKTKEDFAAIQKTLEDAGVASRVSADNLKLIRAGMLGGADAAKKAADNIAAQTEALDNNTNVAGKNTSASAQNAAAKYAQADSAEQAAAAEKALADAAESGFTSYNRMIPSFLAHAEQRIQKMSELGATQEQVRQMTLRFYEDLGNMPNPNFEVLIKNSASLSDNLQRQADRFAELRDEANAAAASLSGTAVTSNDLARAQGALRRATDASVGGLVRMDSQTLDNLKSAIDGARQRMQGLADDAKSTADRLEATLARLQGNDAKARDIEQAKKLAALEEQIRQARKRGNDEELQELQRALSLQKQINAEEDKQAKAQVSAARQQAQKQNTELGQSNGISAADVADAWDERIKQAENRGAQNFAEQLRNEARRRAY